MSVAFQVPLSVTDVSAYMAGRTYALHQPEPACHEWLKDQGFAPLSVLDWMLGYRDERWQQGWTDLIDWRGGPCRCGRECK